MLLHLFPPLIALLSSFPSASCSSSPKRGLAYVPSKKHPTDASIWLQPSSDLTWYYNYWYTPTPSLATSSSRLDYVPMLWGAPESSADNGAFYASVKALVDAGHTVSHVLGFNEPDGPQDTGGSALSAKDAAATWIREMEPLRNLSGARIQMGAPAVTGSARGLQWLDDFFAACGGKCSVDFVPVHWYGTFEGLASYLGQVRLKFADKDIWVTEFAISDATLLDSQGFFNQSTRYFDGIDYIPRYSYFGAFRSDVSNIGPSAAMLTQDGRLTDIGSWYLGGGATGAVPMGDSQRVSPASCWVLLVGMLCVWGLV